LSVLVILVGLAVSAPVAVAAPAASTSKAAPGTVVPVDLNQASESELTAVPGIGPATAQRILEFRKEHGPFTQVDDLLKIKGIGEKSLEKLRPYVKVAKAK
jgi:competence protein ComEA